MVRLRKSEQRGAGITSIKGTSYVGITRFLSLFIPIVQLDLGRAILLAVYTAPLKWQTWRHVFCELQAQTLRSKLRDVRQYA